MKKFALSFLIMCTSVSTFAASSNYFVGNWVNNNSNNVTHLIVTQNISHQLTINIFGKCHPRDCPWGPVNLTTYTKSTTDKNAIYGMATWDMHHKNWKKNSITTTVLLKKLDRTHLKITTFTVFHDHSSRPNFTASELMKRTK